MKLSYLKRLKGGLRMDRDLKIWAVVLTIVFLVTLVIVSFQTQQDYLIEIAQLKTELSVKQEMLEKEIEELKEIQRVLVEENQELKEKLKRYETLSNYMEQRFKTANPGLSDEKVDEL